MYLVKMCYYTDTHSFVYKQEQHDTIQECRRVQIRWLRVVLRDLIGENGIEATPLILSVGRQGEHNELLVGLMYDVALRVIDFMNNGEGNKKKRLELTIETVLD